MMTSRERFLLALKHKEADRVPICDAPWETTVRRWHNEGLPKDKTPFDYFGYERVSQGADLSFQFPKTILEETPTHRIVKDAFGATTRVFKNQESVPETLDFTIKDRKTWEEHKPRLRWNESRVNWEAGLRANRAYGEKGLFATFQAGCFGYDVVQRFTGAPQVLEGMMDDPDWIKDMIDTVAELIIAAVEEMLHRGFRFDGAFIANDMAYKNGPFFSPAMYGRFELPSQKRMCDFFHRHGMPVILHSDGDIRKLLPGIIEAGFDCIQPLEVKAGMDVVELKKQYGERLAFMGGIDVRAMADPDPSAIECEISRNIPFAKRGGGYIFHTDHSVADNVSFSQYKRTIELVLKYGTF